MMETPNLNIAILGPTGVGKSSLINYLFDDKELREAGAGKPVTEKGFYMTKKIINGVPINLIDSWGIENGKTEEWEKHLKVFMKDHNVEKEVSEWIHIAMYCISAASDRVQDYDIQTIKHLLKDNIEVVVVLTKIGRSSIEAIAQMTETIQQELGEKKIKIIEANSVQETMMGGMVSKQQGKEELFKAFQLNYLEMLKKRLPDRILSLLHQQIDHHKNEIAQQTKRKEAGELAEKLHNQFWNKEINEIVGHEIHQALATYANTLVIKFDKDSLEKHGYGTDFKKLLVQTGLNLGVTRLIGLVLGAVVPVADTVVSVAGIGLAIKTFVSKDKSTDEIAALFYDEMKTALQKNTGKIRKAILDALEELKNATEATKQLA